MAQKYGVKRSVILGAIGIADDYDDLSLPSPTRIEEAVRILDAIKATGLPAPAAKSPGEGSGNA